MREDERAQRAIAPLRNRPIAVDDAATLDERRSRTIAQINGLLSSPRTIRGSTAQRTALWKRRAMGLAAAACVALVSSWVFRNFEDEPAPTFRLSTEGTVTFVKDGTRRLVAGDGAPELLTAGSLDTGTGSRAVIERNDGLRMRLGERTRIDFTDLRENAAHVSLAHGRLGLSVPPQQPGSAFSVHTPDAVVTVIGTVFRVRVHESHAGPRTCVRVDRGRVSVERKGRFVRLSAGESSGCESQHFVPTPRKEAKEATPTPPTGSARGPSTNAATSRRAPSSKAPTPRRQASTLAEENRLLRSALAAEQSGNRKDASRRLRRLLEQYPNSPLAGEARSALERVRRKP